MLHFMSMSCRLCDICLKSLIAFPFHVWTWSVFCRTLCFESWVVCIKYYSSVHAPPSNYINGTIDSSTSSSSSVEALFSMVLPCLWTKWVVECDCEGISSLDSILSNGVADATVFSFTFAFIYWVDDYDGWGSLVPFD